MQWRRREFREVENQSAAHAEKIRWPVVDDRDRRVAPGLVGAQHRAGDLVADGRQVNRRVAQADAGGAEDQPPINQREFDRLGDRDQGLGRPIDAAPGSKDMEDRKPVCERQSNQPLQRIDNSSPFLRVSIISSVIYRWAP